MIGRILRAAACVLAAAAIPAAAVPAPQSVLFIGNSFTFGALSPVWKYRAASVTDLNGDGVGGVPALFALFAHEAGLEYRVSLETSPGKTLAWHWANKRTLLDRPWDHVVMQEYSTLDPDRPGDPAHLIADAGTFAAFFAKANPKVDISLTATWSRPDQTYQKSGAWYGRSIAAMAADLRRGYDRAAAASPAIARVNPAGQAFTCAIAAGVADPDPYNGTAFGQIDPWSYDHYHASAFGYYLEALTVFAGITGRDPTALGRDEQAAAELGIAPDVAAALQAAARDAVAGAPCATGLTR